jgi:hypothetical protein
MSFYIQPYFVFFSFCNTLSTGLFSAHVAPMDWKQYFITPWANSLEHEQQVGSTKLIHFLARFDGLT